jgi:hypothetical protein
MGIFYGDIHYGLKISQKIVCEEVIFFNTIYKVKFDDTSNSLSDYIDQIKNIYLNLLNQNEFQYELLVDIYTTYDNIHSYKGWQIISPEQVINFINKKYKLDYLN